MGAPRFSNIIARQRGLFGDIVIYDLDGRRWFDNCDIVQGVTYLTPSAPQVLSDTADGPGPVQGCTYSLGWILAGIHAPKGRAVMFGMGSGEGAVALLYHFPELVLDVVDPDQAVFELAQEHYPLVRHYMEQGRLIFCKKWAEDYVKLCDVTAEFLIFDIDDGSNSVSGLLHDSKFVAALSKVAKSVWVNLLAGTQSKAVQQVFSVMQSQGTPIRCSFSCQPRTSNTIATTCDIDLSAISDYVLYPGLEASSVSEMRDRYSGLVRTASMYGGPAHG